MNKFCPLIGSHPANRVVMQAINKAAQTDEPILITGETGTGKELIADAIQKQSKRRNEAYNKIDCAALPSICTESVFRDGNESQIAALEKTTQGLFKELCGGTLLLDRIEFLPMNIQMKMLQLIEQGDYCSSSDRQTEGGVRFLMVTNANLLQLVKKGMFLEGLFARLSASQIHVPTLRERHTDIPLLIGYYLGQMSKHLLRLACISTDPEFTEKAADIVGLYLNPPLNALVLSVDEKPSIQALERQSGYVQTRDKTWVKAYKSTYKRHGTLNLFAALNVATGEIKGQTTQTKTRDDFRQFMASLVEDEPLHREIHVILDNYCTHKRNEDWLADLGRPVYFHYTPTSASWLSQIEIWFGILSRKTLKQASFTSTDDLKNAIEAFISRHNQQAQPFKWRRREVKGSQIKNTITNLRN